MRSVLLALALLTLPVSTQAQQNQSVTTSVLNSAFSSKPWVKLSMVDANDAKIQPAFSVGISFPTKWETSSSVLYRTVNGRGPEWEFGVSKALW